MQARSMILIGAMLGIGGCAATPTPVARSPSPPRAAAVSPAPVSDAVIGRTARELEAAFGQPHASLTEGPARKLQFASAVCVLDAYLYAPASGREPAVTHVDTRTAKGDDFDRASCVAALRLGRVN